MSNWPISTNHNTGYVSNVQASETEYNLQVSPGASAHTKGSWVEFTSGLDFDVGMLVLNINATYQYAEWLVDIAIGASGSEVVLINNLLFNLTAGSYWSNGSVYYLPIHIPSGTRIAIRQQCVYGAPNNWLKMTINYIPLNSFGQIPLQHCETFGANTADTGGTSIDPGGTANTKGSWVELSSSIPYAVRALFFALGSGNDTFKTSAYWAIDVGIGAASSEEAIIRDFSISLWASTRQMFPQVSPIFPVSLAEGSRLAARCKCTITTAVDRLQDIIVYGFS